MSITVVGDKEVFVRMSIVLLSLSFSSSKSQVWLNKLFLCHVLFTVAVQFFPDNINYNENYTIKYEITTTVKFLPNIDIIMLWKIVQITKH